MTTDTSPRSAGHGQWILLANAGRARCFERDPATHALSELAGFVHQEARERSSQTGTDRPGRAFKGEASTSFEPRTDPHDKQRESFARELGAFLEAAAQAHRYAQLALIASSPFLGALRAHLGEVSRHSLVSSQALDLTELEGRELEERVTSVLAGPGH